MANLPWDVLTPREKSARLTAHKVVSMVRSGQRSLGAAARELDMSTEAVLRNIPGFVKKGGRWRPRPNVRSEISIRIYEDGRAAYIRVASFADASLIGRYMNAVKSFLRTYDPGFIEPFIGVAITDTDGREHVLETDPRELYLMWERRPYEGEMPIYQEDP